MSKYPVESIEAGGEFQRGMLAGLVCAAEHMVPEEVARADARLQASRRLLTTMHKMLATENAGSNVESFSASTKAEIPPNQVLLNAARRDLEEVVVVGIRRNGDQFFASSSGDAAEQLWLVEMFKHALMNACLTPE